MAAPAKTVKPNPTDPSVVAARTDKFFAEVLTGIGAPVTPTNIGLLRSWQQAEGGTAAWNPWNTTQRIAVPGVTDYNTTGVKNYPTESAGVTATVSTLLNGKYNPVVSGLRSENPEKFVSALVASPWDGGYQGRGKGKTFKDSTVWQRWVKNQPGTYTKAGGVGAPVGASYTTPGAAPVNWLTDLIPGYDAIQGGVTSLGGFVKILSSGAWWIRFAEMVGGVIIIVWSFLMLIGKTDVGKAVISKGIQSAKLAAMA
jgi:hypothetical protein